METPEAGPEQRTRWNVRDSDATLILGGRDPAVSAGSKLALACAIDLARPHLVIDLGSGEAVVTACAWASRIAPDALNIAGPRESEALGIYRLATDFLNNLF